LNINDKNKVQEKLTIAVLGGGSFGTAVANIAANNLHDVTLWMRSESICEEIKETHINQRYLPKCKLHGDLKVTTDVKAALIQADLVFVAVPGKALKSVMQEVQSYIQPFAKLVSLTKGIEPETFDLMSQVLEKIYPDHSVGVISGPNLAKEVAAGQLTGTVAASKDKALCATIQSVLSNGNFRVYTNPDLYGVELAGALKNIYAIVSGMIAAMDMGANTQAMIITRSLAEMSRFAAKMGANPLTFLGLAGVGDLIVTCTSPLSRNYRVGFAVGQGYNLTTAIKQLGEVAEGINTLKMIKSKADELKIRMPLVDGLYSVLYEGKDLDWLAESLMLAAHEEDVEFITGVS
jgi:glycerol-3-phosphate dehydrogenase (NAD(P)+)